MPLSTPVQKVTVKLEKLFILLSAFHDFKFVAAQQLILS